MRTVSSAHISRWTPRAALLKTVTKFTGEINDADNAAEATIRAFRAATTEPRGAAAVVLPADVLAAPTAATISARLPIARLAAAPSDAIQDAAALIRAAQRPTLLVGTRGADPESCRRDPRLISRDRAPVDRDLPGRRGCVTRLEDHYLGGSDCSAISRATSSSSPRDVLITVGYDRSNTTRRCGTPDVADHRAHRLGSRGY